MHPAERTSARMKQNELFIYVVISRYLVTETESHHGVAVSIKYQCEYLWDPPAGLGEHASVDVCIGQRCLSSGFVTDFYLFHARTVFLLFFLGTINIVAL